MVIHDNHNLSTTWAKIGKILTKEVFCIVAYIYHCENGQKEALTLANLLDKKFKSINMRQIVIKVLIKEAGIMSEASHISSCNLDNIMILQQSNVNVI